MTLGVAVVLLGCGAPPAGPNVVVVVVDALRADHLGCYGYARPTSPFVDGLAERGVLFEAAVSASSHTVPATLSLLTATYPRRHGNQFFPETQSFRAPKRRVRPQLPEALTPAAERFRAVGYRTAAVVANPWLDPRYGFDRGFEHYRYVAKSADESDHPSAASVNEEAERLLRSWLDGGNRSAPGFFLYLHYMNTHNPYQAPQRYRDRFVSGDGRYVYRNGPVEELAREDLEHTRAWYDAAIRGLDDQIRDLFQMLERLDLAGSTLVVFTADHGDEFHEHGGLGHGITLYQEVVRVPLLFVHPDLREHARRIRVPVSTVDVLPTVLEWVGADPPEGLDGISLWPWIVGAGQPPADRALVSELGNLKAVRLGPHKGIQARSDAAARIFDLAADPGERRPLAADAPWAAPLRSALSGLLGAAGADELSPAPPSPEEERLEEQLRALGYLE
jgi:arylsulfatase A-like enzyme